MAKIKKKEFGGKKIDVNKLNKKKLKKKSNKPTPAPPDEKKNV